MTRSFARIVHRSASIPKFEYAHIGISAERIAQNGDHDRFFSFGARYTIGHTKRAAAGESK